MTRVYIRINRNGEWINKEVEYLSKKERDEYFKNVKEDELIRWIELLCQTLSSIIKED